MKTHKRGHADKNTQRKTQRNLPGGPTDPKKPVIETLEQFSASHKDGMGIGIRIIVAMQIQRPALLDSLQYQILMQRLSTVTCLRTDPVRVMDTT
jgi:hypothetical protein